MLSVLPEDKWQQHTILLAVSGGPDSIALLRLIHRITTQLRAGTIHVAHANHQLRGHESDQDEAHVKLICSQLNLQLHLRQQPPGDTNPDGIESKLRDLRYQMFRDVASEIGARYVMTAHHRDDQTETILFRLIRGTGLSGLAGIPATRELCQGVTLVRPLLSISRSEILQYLEALGQSFRVDGSNAESIYARNKIRNRLIPLIQQEFTSNLNQSLETLSTQAAQHQDFLDQQCEPLLAQYVSFGRCELRISRTPVGQLHPVLRRHLLVRAWKKMGWPLQDMTFAKWNQVAELFPTTGQPAAIITLPGAIRVVAGEQEIRFSSPDQAHATDLKRGPE